MSDGLTILMKVACPYDDCEHTGTIVVNACVQDHDEIFICDTVELCIICGRRFVVDSKVEITASCQGLIDEHRKVKEGAE